MPKAEAEFRVNTAFGSAWVYKRDTAQVWYPMGSQSTKGVARTWSMVLLKLWNVYTTVSHREDFPFNGVPVCFVMF